MEGTVGYQRIAKDNQVVWLSTQSFNSHNE
jgi:hypothetical protein